MREVSIWTPRPLNPGELRRLDNMRQWARVSPSVDADFKRCLSRPCLVSREAVEKQGVGE